MEELLNIECTGVVNLGWLPQASGNSTSSKLVGILHVKSCDEAVNAIDIW